jgi:hypothetical protein
MDGAERVRADRPGAPCLNERPGARWPGADTLGEWASACAAEPPGAPMLINLHCRPELANTHGNRRRGREGARAIQTIPRAQPRPTGSASGSVRPARRAVGGAPEHRSSCHCMWRDHPAEWR